MVAPRYWQEAKILSPLPFLVYCFNYEYHFMVPNDCCCSSYHIHFQAGNRIVGQGIMSFPEALPTIVTYIYLAIPIGELGLKMLFFSWKNGPSFLLLRKG